jgi:hypothetical protein
MSDKYIPLGRDFELQMRTECPEYREMRLRIAQYWRRLRRIHGAPVARYEWQALIMARRDTVRMITDNMFYQSRLLRNAD